MWLNNIRIVLPDGVMEHGSLCIDQHRIVDIVEGPGPGARANGHMPNGHRLTAIPGIIDMHGDMLEREIEPRPGAHFPFEMAVNELDKRLACNGVTTAYAAISFAEGKPRKDIRSEEHARDIITTTNRMRESLLVDMRIHARFEVTNQHAPPILSELIEANQVQLISLTDHTPGQGQYRDLERYIQQMSEWRKMTSDTAEVITMERIRESQARPPAWDVVRDITRMATQQGLIIASHDDDSVEKVDMMANMGVTISEFPVTVEAAREARRHGMSIVMGAPNAMRGVSHSGNLSALDAIAAGVVDMLASDYHPAAMLQAALMVVRRGLLPLHEAVKLISTNAAHALGMAGQGSIAIGNYADLALVDMTPHYLHPRVRATFRYGSPIFMDHDLMHYASLN